MDPAVFDIHVHMRDLGLAALAHATRHASISSIENHRLPELAVLQAAHAAEMLIKARIAEAHPLLIFDQIPKQTNCTTGRLTFENLFESGRTIQWNDLPDRLWATTQNSLSDLDSFRAFGKLRNGIQHFGPPPQTDLNDITLRFVFSVVDPLINASWNLFAVDHCQDDDIYINFTGTLASHEILFLVSPGAAASYGEWNVDWSTVRRSYSKEMKRRVLHAKRAR